jgi:c-di-AMP phosphodiesterase-like protein
MKFKKFEWALLARIVLLLAIMCGIALLVVKANYSAAVIICLLLVFLVFDLFSFTNKSNDELQQFVESVHYRDFSRRFDEKHAPTSLQAHAKRF